MFSDAERQICVPTQEHGNELKKEVFVKAKKPAHKE